MKNFILKISYNNELYESKKVEDKIVEIVNNIYNFKNPSINEKTVILKSVKKEKA